jgi:hypothetical protein
LLLRFLPILTCPPPIARSSSRPMDRSNLLFSCIRNQIHCHYHWCSLHPQCRKRTAPCGWCASPVKRRCWLEA